MLWAQDREIGGESRRVAVPRREHRANVDSEMPVQVFGRSQVAQRVVQAQHLTGIRRAGDFECGLVYDGVGFAFVIQTFQEMIPSKQSIRPRAERTRVAWA